MKNVKKYIALLLFSFQMTLPAAQPPEEPEGWGAYLRGLGAAAMRPIRQAYNTNTFIGAAGLGDLDKLKSYLGNPENSVNDTGMGNVSALYNAAQNGQIEAVQFLLESPEIDVNITTSRGQTPLLAAVQAGNIEIVQLLLDAGADITNAERIARNKKDAAEKRGDMEAAERYGTIARLITQDRSSEYPRVKSAGKT